MPASLAKDRSLLALAVLNFFLADARDGLGPFLDGFLATRGWSPMALGLVATIGGVLGIVATPFFGAWVDATHRKRTLIILPVLLVTAAALWTLASPGNAAVFGGQSATAIVAGWLTDLGGYSLAYFVHGGVALFAVAIFCTAFGSIAPSPTDEDDRSLNGSNRVDLAEGEG